MILTSYICNDYSSELIPPKIENLFMPFSSVRNHSSIRTIVDDPIGERHRYIDTYTYIHINVNIK